MLDWLEREHGVASDGTNGVWYALRLHGRIGHAPEASLWRAPIHGPTFVAIEHDDLDADAARAQLVRRYLAAFGPATRAEISGWSGLKVRDFADRLDGLVRLRDDRGRELLDLARAPRPAAGTPAPVRFLPKFDNILLDRERVLPEAYRKVVVRKNADVQPTFTVDGLVAGDLAGRKETRRARAVHATASERQARARGRGRAPRRLAQLASARAPRRPLLGGITRRSTAQSRSG